MEKYTANTLHSVVIRSYTGVQDREKVIKHLRGRRPIDQSQKKPKICKNKQRGEPQWWHIDRSNHDENTNSACLLGDFIETMKRMNPQPTACRTSHKNPFA